MQILSLHWMMQNIRLFNVCEAFSLLRDIKKLGGNHEKTVLYEKKSIFDSLKYCLKLPKMCTLVLNKKQFWQLET